MAVKKESGFKKWVLIGIFLLLLFISYQLYNKNNAPKTEMDCLNLGSNERTKLCLELLKQEKTLEDFPLTNLTIENVKGEDADYCVQLSGTVYNSGSLPATLIAVRADFSKEMNGASFHYEVFSPFQTDSEQIQPNSRKSFSKCMNPQTYSAVKSVNQWYFSMTPYSAKILSQ
ncbi:MAG: hypothetical protein US96_C0033G0007 [Candidatus Woesebacteria bacterium GW2011_GWB1_38_5b]|uniref:DUF2393 domain-containing protein n=1 Tax=Candidatus Woesebacteria bacterium GW2011_GWB1_38_5b TaxID=1618569 RepID=A0A0G0KFX1_9BACT|nr:MAG: hypothetical protein US96_C0033G0007 [Candidatus Woesebacteria bacterium GW2011_GWB1_38_5b]